MRLLIYLVLVSMIITPAFAEDWSMFKKDPSHSGYTDDSVNPPLTLKWVKNLGFETDSSPVIVDDVLYVGTTYGVSAVDVTTGMQLWTYRTDSFVGGVPAISNGVLYVGANDRKFYAINVSDGTLKWVNMSAISGYASSPVVEGTIVYAMPQDGTFYAFDVDTGEIIWSTLIGKISESSPAIGDGIITFGTDGGDVVALDASTGKEKWRYNTGSSDIKSSPAIADGTVFIGSDDGSLYALSADNGNLVWKYSTGDNIESSPSVKNGVVYAGSKDSSFFAIDEKTGKRKWIDPNAGQVLSGPAISSNVVYLATRNNYIEAFDANTGEFLWKNSTGRNDKDYMTSPAISGNTLYGITHSGLLFAYSSAPGPTPTVTETAQATPTPATPTPVPTVASVTPSGTKGSPGFEFPLVVTLITATYIIIRNKK